MTYKVIEKTTNREESNPKTSIYWCNSHQRKATHIDKNGRHKCDPTLGGITLPCFVVVLNDVALEDD